MVDQRFPWRYPGSMPKSAALGARCQTRLTPGLLTLRCALICLGLLVQVACSSQSPGLECGPNTYPSQQQCLPDPGLCGPGTALDTQSGLCVATTSCAPGTLLIDEQCVPDGSVICQTGTTYNSETGACDADILGCDEGSVLLGDRCVGEDEALMASLEEAAEPNDDSGLAGTIIAPAVASQTSVHGCISPSDSDGDGSVDADVDSYRLRASGPMLLDITVDGVGGLAGAFVVSADGGELATEGWERIGLNLVGDTSSRQVFLPGAGDYLLHIVDSRSVLQGLPVGSATSCYFAGLRGIAMPAAQSIATAASGLLTGNAVFLAYPPESDGEFIRSTLSASSPSAAPALVHMREGLLAGSATGASPVSGMASGLRSGANLVVVIEAHFHYSLDPVPYTYGLSRTSVPAIINGGVSTIATGSMPDQELAWFEASAGDVIHIQIDDANLSISSVERDLSAPRNLLCSPCAASDLHFQASRSGIVYLQIESSSAAASFGAALDLASTTPAPVIVDTALPVQSLGPQGLHFLALEQANPSWNVLTASPTGFSGDLEVRRYPRDASGFLDIDVIADESLLFAGGESVGRIIDDSGASSRRQLLRISDVAFDGSADNESYSLSNVESRGRAAADRRHTDRPQQPRHRQPRYPLLPRRRRGRSTHRVRGCQCHGHRPQHRAARQ